MKRIGLAAALAAAGALAGCGKPAGDAGAAASSAERAMEAVNGARFSTAATASVPDAPVFSPVIVKLQVLLDRARFSPGVIDGKFNENTRQALRAFEEAYNLPVDGVLDRDAWNRLVGADQHPVMSTYIIDPADVAGPFTPHIPPSFQGMARLDSLGYRTPVEALAETFHMDPELLTALNPDVDFSEAGESVIVAQRGADDLGVDVALVEVDSGRRQIRAYAVDHRLLAVYPATVGSEKSPPPSGQVQVKSVEPQPAYRYQTDKVSYGRGLDLAPFEIAAGPNNPVGSVWIELSPGDYGVHGTPEPQDVGKPMSHGGVRLTNWDARELARGVQQGVPVLFR